MRTLLSALLLLTLITPGFTQDFKMISGQNILRSEKIVKNSPFSAEAVSESVQVLADGNRIIRRTVSRLYRDSEGRYRREDMPKQIGLAGAVIDMPESILIIDPVAGYRFQLNPKKNTGRVSQIKQSFELHQNFDFDLKFKLDFKLMEKDLKQVEKDSEKLAGQADDADLAKMQAERAKMQAERAKMQAERAKMQAERAKAAEERQRAAEERKLARDQNMLTENRDKANTRTEELGVQNVEGVEAEGTRTTTIIPAGAIGNERDIETVYEKWYSKDLQMIVFSKNVDPRFGEQTYRLTNISRSEPAIYLFTPPNDYQISVDGVAPAKPVPPVAPKAPSVEKKPQGAVPAKKVH